MKRSAPGDGNAAAGFGEQKAGHGEFTHPRTESPGKQSLFEKILPRGAERMVRIACEDLLLEDGAHVLEWLAGPVSILPQGKGRFVVTGLGASAEELSRNGSLVHRVVADTDVDPFLPLRTGSFDGALVFFGVEKVRRPVHAFKEVARVLKPGGRFLVVFSVDTEGTCPRWSLMDDQERLSLVVSYFDESGGFGPPTAYGTKKRYRSEASRMRHPVRDVPSVWMVYASTKKDEDGASNKWSSRHGEGDPGHDPYRCPYCGERLKKYAVPHSPFEIDYWYESDYLYICFNDDCPYFQRGWDLMWARLRRRVSYRHMYNPATRRSGPVPVPTYYALKDGIVEETGPVPLDPGAETPESHRKG